MSKKQRQPKHKMMRLFKRMAILVGASAHVIHLNSDECNSPQDAANVGKKRVHEFIDRVHKPLECNTEFGRESTIGCMHILAEQIGRHIAIKNNRDIYRCNENGNQDFERFIHEVTMYSVMTNQNWGAAFDELLQGNYS